MTRNVTAVVIAWSLVGCSNTQGPRPLEFHLAQYEQAEGLVPARVEGRTGFIYLNSKIELDDRDIESATAMQNQFGGPSVQVKLRPSGATKMRELTRKHQRDTLAILVAGKVISTPVIMGGQIDDLLDIEGSFTQEESRALAATLNSKR